MQVHTHAKQHWQFPSDDEPLPTAELAPSNFRILIVNEDMRSADSLKHTLHDLGYRDVAHLLGGMDAWAAGDHPVVLPDQGAIAANAPE